MSRIIDEHRQYLEDANRLSAFAKAVASSVRPGDVVLDLGAGTGILGLLACRAGAARVYAVDSGSIIAVARELAEANGYADRIVHVRRLSTWLELPERVDVVVTDQIGGFGFEAGLFESLLDARDRLLKPGGRIVPGRLTLWIAPCTFDLGRRWVEFWRQRPEGFDVSRVMPLAESTGYPVKFSADDLLSAGGVVEDIDLTKTGGGSIGGHVECRIDRSGRIDGLAAWFSSELAPGIVMTNHPTRPDRINRRQVFLPTDSIPAPSGARVVADIKVLPSEQLVRWTVTVEDPSGARIGRCQRSTFGGMLIAREDLRLSAPRTEPTLSRAGQARRVVLELCDGSHAVEAIERAVAERFPDIVRGPLEAARFVAEVLTVYAE